jgi:hypothetical protein
MRSLASSPKCRLSKSLLGASPEGGDGVGSRHMIFSVMVFMRRALNPWPFTPGAILRCPYASPGNQLGVRPFPFCFAGLSRMGWGWGLARRDAPGVASHAAQRQAGGEREWVAIQAAPRLETLILRKCSIGIGQ